MLACGILVTYPRSISIYAYKWMHLYIHACCPVFLNSPIHRNWGLSVTLYHCLSECFPCFWWSWYPIFFSLWRMPTGCLPLGLPRFCFKTYQIFFWSSLTQFFIKTVQVQQLASKDTDRSWCRFQGFHRQAQSYLD